MARIRTIKPEFFTSEDIVEIQPLARLLYIALWCEADKEGRFAWKPKTFKMRYLPDEKCEIDSICDALLLRGLVVTYGDGFAVIPTFKNHQHINPREKDSVLPAPTTEELTRAARVVHAPVTRTEEGRKEGKERKEGKGTSLAQFPDASHAEIPEKRFKKRGSDDDYKTARWMFDLVLTVNATAKQPNFDNWADDVRLMREIDSRTHPDIRELFQWAKRDSFWCANILSPSKPREKWDRLMMQRARPAASKAGLPSQKFNFADVDRSGDQVAQAASMAKHGITIPEGEVEL